MNLVYIWWVLWKIWSFICIVCTLLFVHCITKLHKSENTKRDANQTTSIQNDCISLKASFKLDIYSYPVKGINPNKNYCYYLFFALSIKVTIFSAINDIQYTTVMNSASSSLSGSFWLMFRLLLLSCTSLAVYYILISTVVNTFAWYHISQSLIRISPEQ